MLLEPIFIAYCTLHCIASQRSYILDNLLLSCNALRRLISFTVCGFDAMLLGTFKIHAIKQLYSYILVYLMHFYAYNAGPDGVILAVYLYLKVALCSVVHCMGVISALEMCT